jgi:hypothetical protein
LFAVDATSALPQKADIHRRERHFRFVSKAGISQFLECQIPNGPGVRHHLWSPQMAGGASFRPKD